MEEVNRSSLIFKLREKILPFEERSKRSKTLKRKPKRKLVFFYLSSEELALRSRVR